MKEKVIALAMAALLALALTGCGEDKNNTNRPNNGNDTTNNGTANNGTTNNGTTNNGTADNGTVNNGTANNGTNNGTTDNNGTVNNDDVVGGDDTARSRSGYGSYYDNGNDQAFTNNRGSTFGRTGQEIQNDATQWPGTVYDTMNGWQSASGTATWRQMLENGFVHDSDGFLLDGENACWS